MSESNPSLKKAAIVGLVPAVIEGILIITVEPTINPWILAQAVIFWFTCGSIITLVRTNWPIITSSILLTVFLNLPWYIAESIVKNRIEHLAPLIIASIVQGFIIGILIRRMRL